MNTPKKLKHWRDRTSSASRTQQGRPYHGKKNVRLTRNIGENMPGSFKLTMLPGTVLDEIFTKQDALLPFMPVVKTDDLKVEEPLRDEYNRKGWRNLRRPWRRSRAA